MHRGRGRTILEVVCQMGMGQPRGLGRFGEWYLVVWQGILDAVLSMYTLLYKKYLLHLMTE